MALHLDDDGRVRTKPAARTTPTSTRPPGVGGPVRRFVGPGRGLGGDPRQLRAADIFRRSRQAGARSWPASADAYVIGATPAAYCAARSVFRSSIAIVIGPTPPGTGDIADAFSATAAKSTSPARR